MRSSLGTLRPYWRGKFSGNSEGDVLCERIEQEADQSSAKDRAHGLRAFLDRLDS